MLPVLKSTVKIKHLIKQKTTPKQIFYVPILFSLIFYTDAVTAIVSVSVLCVTIILTAQKAKMKTAVTCFFLSPGFFHVIGTYSKIVNIGTNMSEQAVVIQIKV